MQHVGQEQTRRAAANDCDLRALDSCALHELVFPLRSSAWRAAHSLSLEATMYLKDLSPYRHGVPAPLNDVVAIGWLSSANAYSQGDVGPEIMDALGRLFSSHRVNQMRGYHVCDFCYKSPLIYETESGKQIMLGSAEI
jgi:hypothetical protein